MVHRRLIERLWAKIRSAASELWDWEVQGELDGELDVAFVSFGSASRSVGEAVELLRSKGLRAAGLRLKTLWPFPDEPVIKLATRARTVVVPELNMGQLAREVSRAVAGRADVIGFSKVGGGELPTPEELANFALEVLRK